MENYIQWIGTGSGFNPALGNTSFLYRGKFRTLLVDCGPIIAYNLLESNEINNITDIVLTHRHADHIGGIETLGFMNYFALRNRGQKRPNLYLPTPEFAETLWNNSLKGGMEKIADDNNIPVNANLDTYFKIHIGKTFQVPELPRAIFFETPHAPNFENYGIRFANGIFYSGDTIALPPSDPLIIFQDCQFFQTPSDVHISYEKLKELPLNVRSKTHLVHLGKNYNEFNPQNDGFAGFVFPGQVFEF